MISPDSQPPQRAQALDALRGFAILTMVLSGVIPYGVLPAWMYHAQVPPPLHKFDPSIPGITWVDLVFPFFLFSLGAALPLALARRAASGTPRWRLVAGILERGALLGAFAIFIQHVKPYVLSPTPTRGVWLTALTGFVLLVLMYTRFDPAWPVHLRLGLRLAGWIGAIALLAWVRYPEGSAFSLHRSDIILVVLTNTVVFGGLIWLLTQTHWLARLGVLGLLMAFRLAHDSAGWVHWLWQATPAPWIYKLYYLQYLFIVIPGTIVGDMIRSWMAASSRPGQEGPGWSAGRLAAIVAVMVLLNVVLVAGLKARALTATLFAALALCSVGAWLLAKPAHDTAALLKRMYGWGVYWLFLGLAFEAFEGGIRKDSPTVSYYFVTTGLAIFTLIAFAVIIDLWRRPHWLRVLIENGQNPMIAYVGVSNLLAPVLHLTGIDPLLRALTPTPWLGFLRGVLVTTLLAVVVACFTSKKLFWRT